MFMRPLNQPTFFSSMPNFTGAGAAAENMENRPFLGGAYPLNTSYSWKVSLVKISLSFSSSSLYLRL